MAIFDWLDTVTSEWGVFESTATVDFSRELNVSGALATQGWYCTNGESKYQDFRIISTPAQYITYGALAMNGPCQALQPFLPAEGAPVFTYQALQWDLNRYTPLVVVAAHPHPPVWMADQRIFEPCTVLSFNWADATFYAPMLIGAAQVNVTRFLFTGPLAPDLGRGFIFSGQQQITGKRMDLIPPPGLRRPAVRATVPQGPTYGADLLPGHLQANRPAPDYRMHPPF